MGRGLTLGALCAAVLTLPGCIAVQEEKERQLDQIGDVEIATVVCASRPSAVEPCERGNSGSPAKDGEYQVLVGYRVPVRVRAPESIPTDPKFALDTTLTRSPSLAAELERFEPAGPAQKWYGYISPPIKYQNVGGHYRGKLLARFALQRGADGSPFVGPFKYRLVVGYRVTGEVDPNRPVDCGESLYGGEEAICIDWPSPSTTETNRTVVVRDIGLIPAQLIRISRGQSASVPFTIRHAGPDGAPAMTMTASTEVPGASISAQSPTFAAPKDSASPFLVAVNVPASAPPGVYDVTLTAALANGQTRTSTGQLQVQSGPDRSAPALAIAIPPGLRLRKLLKSGIPVDAACSERCTLSAELRISLADAKRARLARSESVLVGTGRARIASGGRGQLVITLTPKARRRLAKLRTLKATLRVRAQDAAGNRTSRSKRISLR